VGKGIFREILYEKEYLWDKFHDVIEVNAPTELSDVFPTDEQTEDGFVPCKKELQKFLLGLLFLQSLCTVNRTSN
jgi:hypothetical protein